jgi:hypothetical protein
MKTAKNILGVLIKLGKLIIVFSIGSATRLAESAQFHPVDIGSSGSLHLRYSPASIPATSLFQGTLLLLQVQSTVIDVYSRENKIDRDRKTHKQDHNEYIYILHLVALRR